MILNRISLTNLRNHGQTDIECPDGTLLLFGENGAGKTTVLEAIAMLCTSRSFVTHLDRTVMRRDAGMFRVEGRFTSSTTSRRDVSIRYDETTGRKQIEVDHAPLGASAELIGQFPMVALSPQHRPITAGGPAERRAFVDFVISQLHHAYLLDLMAYRRVLRQRNALLADHDGRPSALRSTLAPWDATMAQTAVRILRHRYAFVDAFVPYLREAMDGMIPEREDVALRYQSSVDIDPTDPNAIALYHAELQRRFDTDVRRGTTTAGPHRDELEVLLNGHDIRAHASQGQHKTVLISLKLAEYRYLEAGLDEPPLLLLDDVFSELDDDRLANVLRLVGGLGQTFITSASRATLRHFPQDHPGNRTLRIEAGVAEVA
ncbi:MAG: DNA replication and repair protein RecF [Bacteroidota bacterium]|jgi:DNA replication and repair protein RecF|nr:DNA replication and repair protein RecF [Bacteroidota bacterium]